MRLGPSLPAGGAAKGAWEMDSPPLAALHLQPCTCSRDAPHVGLAGGCQREHPLGPLGAAAGERRHLAQPPCCCERLERLVNLAEAVLVLGRLIQLLGHVPGAEERASLHTAEPLLHLRLQLGRRGRAPLTLGGGRAGAAGGREREGAMGRTDRRRACLTS